MSGPEADRRSLAMQFDARPVFVLVGMHRSGAAVLARMLQLLGVDMADPAAGGWERPEIAAFNDRLLAAIGRPLSHPAHALPFPPGWWGDPQVLAIKREVQAHLRDTLHGRYGLWGFKDLRVTRLLPFWQQVFDEMGLRPIYLWAVRDPAECTASAVAAGLVDDPQMAEAMWFIYNADAHKYAGDEAVAIVDYTAWRDEPARVVETLLGRLPLSWRGSQAELLECLRAITRETRARADGASPIHSPLVQAFYEAIRDPERTERSLRTRDSVAQAVDVLRTLVAPFAKLADAPAAAAPTASRTMVDDEALVALRLRAERAETALRETEEALSRELEERAAEAGWLHQQFQDQKRALALLEEQRHQATVRTDTDSRRMLARLDELDRALTQQKEANRRYLSRIYELKASPDVSADGGQSAATAA